MVLIPSEVPHSFHALSPIRFGVLLADRIPSEVKELFDRLIQDGRTRIIALSRLDRDRYERLFREWLRIRSAPLKDPIRNYAVWVELLLLFLNEHAHSDHQALSISFIGDYIRQHIQDPVHVSALAEMSGTVRGWLPQAVRQNIRHDPEAVPAAMPARGSEVALKLLR
ncbi:Uncharacterised protein [Actinobacillus pleuropneumoniae]|nr:Uncharacterised protein [Actinobacillus pleuropneumoniae]